MIAYILSALATMGFLEISIPSNCPGTLAAMLSSERPTLVFDLPPGKSPRIVTRRKFDAPDPNVWIHLHCPEELNGGGYRNGKFVYLKDVAQ